MSIDQDAAARRIMDQFGEESRIPYLNIEEGDVGVLIAFPIVGLFIAGLTGIESLALPFVAGGFGFGVAIVYVSPDHLNAWTWTKDVRSWVEDCWSVLSSSWKSQRARVTRSRHPTNDDANQDVRLGASGRESASTDSLA